MHSSALGCGVLSVAFRDWHSSALCCGVLSVAFRDWHSSAFGCGVLIVYRNIFIFSLVEQQRSNPMIKIIAHSCKAGI
jgi:hypothetical protein